MRKFMKFLLVMMCMILILSFGMSIKAEAANVTSGTLGDNGGISWTYDADTKTLTITGEDTGVSGYDGTSSGSLFRVKNICPDVEYIYLKDCKLYNCKFLFANLDKVKSITFDNFDTSEVTSMKGMFSGCSGIEELDLSDFVTVQVTDMSRMFQKCSALTSLDLSSFDTENVTNMGQLFQECSSLISLDLSGVNTQNVTIMSNMFDKCSSLSELDLKGFNTSKVTSMRCMFYDCFELRNLDLSGFNTQNVKNMQHMFYSCDNLTSIDISSFDTSNVMSMKAMFYSCDKLADLDVSNFNTSKVTDMSYMFAHSGRLRDIDVSGFDTSNVTDMSYMFRVCTNLTNIDVSGFNMSNVTDVGEMFNCCRNLTSLDLSGFDLSKASNLKGMIGDCYKIDIIHTPKKMPVEQSIELEGTYLDENNCVVDEINNTNIGMVLVKIKKIQSIELSRQKLGSLVVGETDRISAKISPTDASMQLLSWKSDNSEVLTVDENGNVKAVGPGIATITAIAKDGTNVSASCTVTVKKENPFADVKETDWEYPFVEFVYDHNIMAGKGKTAEGKIIFDPDNYMTRAEFVQTLYNKEGKPAVIYTDTFTDVPEGQWYTNAILWASQNGIVAGKGDKFDISGKITREEVATILYKYATNYKKYDTTGRASLDAYEDTESISSWAVNNMKWAIHYGIMKGRGNVLAPKDNASRAECATMLKNFMDAYND